MVENDGNKNQKTKFRLTSLVHSLHLLNCKKHQENWEHVHLYRKYFLNGHWCCKLLKIHHLVLWSEFLTTLMQFLHHIFFHFLHHSNATVFDGCPELQCHNTLSYVTTTQRNKRRTVCFFHRHIFFRGHFLQIRWQTFLERHKKQNYFQWSHLWKFMVKQNFLSRLLRYHAGWLTPKGFIYYFIIGLLGLVIWIVSFDNLYASVEEWSQCWKWLWWAFC